MSKELEALERIKECLFWSEDGLKDYDLIETALKRLENIENTTPSVLREDISKQLKALEIIKKKQIDVGVLVLQMNTWCCDDNFALKRYNTHIKNMEEKWKLTREEYELLKEALNDAR